MSKDTEGRRASPVDQHVGVRMRMRRKLLGMGQDQLAEALGLTFQQVQKYERGENRVSASKLHKIATILRVEVTYFFDGLPDPLESRGPDDPGPQADRVVQTFLETPEGIQLAELFPRIGPSRVRRQLVDLVRVMAEAEI